MNKIFNEIYYDLRREGSYSSAHALYKEAQKILPMVTLRDAEKWLSTQFAYQLHKPARRKWKRNKIIVSTFNELYQCDLVDMYSPNKSFVRTNSGYKFLLTAVDVFSKLAFAIPLKSKKGEEVKSAFEQIFKERIPQKIQADAGREFLNRPVQDLFESLGIQFYTSKNPQIKCGAIERFNRTLRGKMHKYFTARGTQRWVEVAKDLVYGYNNTVHSVTKQKPSEVNETNETEVFKRLYGHNSMRELLLAQRGDPRVKTGDTIRLQHKTDLFTKGAWPLWENQVHKVEHINRNLIKVDGSKRRFYPFEVQQIDPDTEFLVEKVLRSRGKGRTKQYFCKFLNHPSEFNSWVEAKNLRYLDGHDH